jgi:proline racemase
VTITVPGFGPIKVDVPVAGAFYVVDEKTGKSELAK